MVYVVWLSVLSWKLQCVFLRRGTDPTNLDVPEIKILHLPKGQVLSKLHQSWDSSPIQEEIPNALHRLACLCPALPSSTQQVKSKSLTFLSFLPKLSPGVPFSSTRQEMPLGPGPPVRHMTTYTSVSPPPLMKACRRAQEERDGFCRLTMGLQQQLGYKARRYLGAQTVLNSGERSAEPVLPWENTQR